MLDDSEFRTFGGHGMHMTKNKVLKLKCFKAWASVTKDTDYLEARLN